VTSHPGERLNRYLARRGVASRRAADALIASGRVTVNGQAGRVGAVIDPGTDAIAVDGAAVPARNSSVTLALNKPTGVVSTRHDPQGRTTVMDLVEPLPGLVPVGRLDADSRGLLLLTTDGDLAHRVAHPRYGVRKRYRVSVASAILDTQLERLLHGVQLSDGRARAVAVQRGAGPRTLEITMAEGRRREVRRMCAAVGLDVVDLIRVAVGPIELGRLDEGASRRLTDREEGVLREVVAMQPETHARTNEELPRYDAGRVVTVDGPAGSGKTTLGERLADSLHMPFIDTGLFYRAIAVAATHAGLHPDDNAALANLARRSDIVVNTDVHADGPRVLLNGVGIDRELYDVSLASMLSAVSAVPEVRAALLAAQRAPASAGAVAVGRDCGTVVFPEARVKFYLEAASEVRTRRRAEQVRAHGGTVDAAALDAEVDGRDRADSLRIAAPLRPAPDAHIIDTETNGIDEMVQIALGICAQAGLVAA
jgi:23S rRNA pseudouridine2605 synthase